MQAAIEDRSSNEYVELLLVWSWRKIVSSRGNCPGIEREFNEWAGEAGRKMLLTYAAFLKALGHGSRRTLSIGHPGLLAFTPDERQVIALLAAAQAGDDVRLSAHLEWLIRADCQCTAGRSRRRPDAARRACRTAGHFPACGGSLTRHTAGVEARRFSR